MCRIINEALEYAKFCFFGEWDKLTNIDKKKMRSYEDC
jgi:hypothetical protein